MAPNMSTIWRQQTNGAHFAIDTIQSGGLKTQVIVHKSGYPNYIIKSLRGDIYALIEILIFRDFPWRYTRLWAFKMKRVGRHFGFHLHMGIPKLSEASETDKKRLIFYTPKLGLTQFFFGER